MKAIYGAWNTFWFDSNREDSLLALSIFRIAFYGVMFFFYFSRASDVALYYGENGFLPAEYSRTLPMMKYHLSFLTYVHSTLWLHLFHGIFLLSLACVVLGLFTRMATVLSFFLHLMFIHRNMSVMFGVDMIATYFLLYSCFAQLNAHWSLDRRIFPGKVKSSMTSFVAFRLLQIQVCVIYAYSGLEKLRGTRWWDGSALWDVLCIGNLQRWDMSFVSHVPLLLSLGVYLVLFWEIYFPLLVWNPKLKNYMLSFGVLMHIGIGVFMNLPSFAVMMMSFYLLFLSGEEIRRARALIPSRS